MSLSITTIEDVVRVEGIIGNQRELDEIFRLINIAHKNGAFLVVIVEKEHFPEEVGKANQTAVDSNQLFLFPS